MTKNEIKGRSILILVCLSIGFGNVIFNPAVMDKYPLWGFFCYLLIAIAGYQAGALLTIKRK